MHHSKHLTVCGSVLALTLLAATVSAQAEDVARLGGGNPKSPSPRPSPCGRLQVLLYQRHAGRPRRLHPRANRIVTRQNQGYVDAVGLTFGDVVKATVFMAGDPAKNGDLDFAGMNQAWSKAFGTPEQPNKPARSTIKVRASARKGAWSRSKWLRSKSCRKSAVVVAGGQIRIMNGVGAWTVGSC